MRGGAPKSPLMLTASSPARFPDPRDFDDQGLVACTHDTQTLSRYDLQSGARSVLVSDYQGKHFNSPNDVALRAVFEDLAAGGGAQDGIIKAFGERISDQVSARILLDHL